MVEETKERFILNRMYKDEKEVKIAFLVILILVLFIIFNIVYLNLVSFNNLKPQYFAGETSSLPSPVPTAILTPTSTPIPTLAVEKPIYEQPITQNTGPKEYFVAFGSGTSAAADWEDVSGAEAVIDLGSYQNIKEIKFEVSVSVPNANQAVSVRLYNKTDKHPVWFSEVNMSGGASSYLVSSPISFNTGSKTYQVQMKTQLKYTANLTQSRLHIVLN